MDMGLRIFYIKFKKIKNLCPKIGSKEKHKYVGASIFIPKKYYRQKKV